MLNVEHIRKDFPILNEKVNGEPLIYFDNGASSQKPIQVINTIVDYYKHINSNIHRGVHSLSQKATQAHEEARAIIQKYLNAALAEEVIFTSGTTESINLVASSYETLLSKDDEILTSGIEHHTNIVPWQLLCQKTGAKLKVIKINDRGHLDLDHFQEQLSSKTKIVCISHVSNAFGTINPIETIIEKAHQVGAVVMIDGAQAICHMKPNVQKLNCDFYAFSGHKVFGPTGTGVLYGKKSLLDQLPPYKGGGGMIKTVTFEQTSFGELPHKFEAGTPNICGIIALGEAIKYIDQIGIDAIESYEQELLTYATEQLKSIKGLKIYGEAPKTAILSFNIEGLHAYDIGMILDKKGIAVRTGHHCAQPIMDQFGISGTLRASLLCYNTKEEIDRFAEQLKFAITLLS